MNSEWRKTTLGDFVTLQRGHDLTEPDRKSGHVPVMGSAGQNGFHDTALAKGPGVIIGRSGASFGQVHFCPTDYWPHNTGLYVTDFKENDPRFAFYLLKALNFDRYNSGSAQPSLNRNFIYPIPIRVPEPAEQKTIAHILGTLDDKIELNRQMNSTLEAMARALFQNWFIDFDPVRAKLDGCRCLGLDPSAAALFSNSFRECELGLIPAGWTKGKLGDIATNQRRGVQPNEIAPNTPYIALEHMPRRCVALDDWDESAAVASGKSAFKKGEILFGKLRPYFHKVGIAPLNGVCSTDILVLAPKSPEWFAFLLQHVSSDELIAYTDRASTGTKMPRTSWNDLSAYPVILPPVPIAAAFTFFVQPLIDRIICNLHANRTLAAVREALLPKLLSGKINILL